MILTHVCPKCREVHTLEVPDDKMAKWPAFDGPVQSFWPELTPAQREEFFLSGTCDACWKKIFREAGED